MEDAYGRKINYLRISVTDLCNLRCKYCMPEDGIPKIRHEDILTVEEFYEIAKVFVSLGIDKVRITGGEPLVKRGMVSVIEKIGSLDGVKDFAMTTNGTLLGRYGKDLKEAALDRVNISLDTLDEDKYSYITRGGKLKDALNGIKVAGEVGLKPIKINTVLIGGFNDDEIVDFVNLTLDNDIDVRFIEMMPIGQAADWAESNFVSNDLVLERARNLEKITNPDKSSPAVYYKLPNAKGRVGLINPISCKFCSECNRIRLTAEGKLKLCLHSDREIDLKRALREGKDLKELIKNIIREKPRSHNLEVGKYILRNMNQIGG